MKTAADLHGVEIRDAYWLPEDGTILFFTKGREYLELGCARLHQDKSGAYPRIWGVRGTEGLFGATVELAVRVEEQRVLHKHTASVCTLHIRTNRGACVVLAAMEKVTDDNEVTFTLEPYIGYPPVTAISLVDLEDGMPTEDWNGNKATRH